MNLGKNKMLRNSRLSLTVGALLLMGVSVASAQKKPAAPAPHVSAPAAKAPASRGAGGASTSHGSTTTGPHGPTTAGSHGPTTAGTHGMTTTGTHGGMSTPGVHNTVPNGREAVMNHASASRVPGAHGPDPSHTSYEHHGGADMSRRPNGQPRDVHMANGMNVHHNLNGERRFEHERPDHSRVVAEHGGRGYVEHPYRYGGRDFGRRTYYHDGRVYDRYYGNYYYRGVYVNYYTPAYYYRPAFYGWAYNPWAVPVSYSWGFAANPWYGYYGYYFQPYPVYPSAAAWLTDYMISVSLAAAYANAQAQAVAAASGPPPGAAPLTQEVKDLISQEVQRQIALANAEAQTAQTAAPDPASSIIQRLLSDNIRHIFLVGHTLDVVNSSGGECAVSTGEGLGLEGLAATGEAPAAGQASLAHP